MRFASCLGVSIAACFLAGCAGSSIDLRTDTAPSMRGSAPPAGTSYSSGMLHAELSSTPYLGLLFFGIAAAVQDSHSGWNYGSASRTPPPLAEDRAVAERDCSQPMDAMSANLRCK